jgi:hypothetical protein
MAGGFAGTRCASRRTRDRAPLLTSLSLAPRAIPEAAWSGGVSLATDAVAALRAAQAADKLFKAGDREQGLVAAASYRTGCAIFAGIVAGAWNVFDSAANAHRLLPYTRLFATARRSRHRGDHPRGD